jgi:ATP-dependent helicase/nuclease subunit A
LLFRAMTQVHIYEAVFRRANIPYQTVLGRGFYEREEITDLIQLLRFLDNKTDELALAAVLRSPLCGISDNALLALRSAPLLAEVETGDPLRGFSVTRRLYTALRRHREIAFISAQEHELLDRASRLISELVDRRHHYTIHDLLRFAVAVSEYMTVIAANFDGAQRLANVERLFTLAARFESSGTYLIRDFVRYVEEFEAIGSRESEGQIDQAADAVRLMTIHQAKGLEFPVVIIPDLQRLSRVATDTWVLLDRHQGLTLKVPDGRGNLVAGCTFANFEKRYAWREQFESMRLLYVAASRAEDRLILSGATEELATLDARNDSWLKWIWQSLELQDRRSSGVVELADDVQLQLTINLAEDAVAEPEAEVAAEPQTSLYSADSLSEAFPLIKPLSPQGGNAIHRFSVTQLINYQRCPRQYYFDRVLQVPSRDQLAVWNTAEAPEPPANLTATLKGAVIHRFCERYTRDQSAEECLRVSFEEIVRLRQAQLADRLVEIDYEAAIKDLLPLAKNYLASDVFERVDAVPKVSGENEIRPVGGDGLWSELSFRLRRPLGVLNGIIDKLLITHSPAGDLEIEIIDFKTNRIPTTQAAAEPASPSRRGDQFAFDFENPARSEAVHTVAEDYELQMQAYALAVRELLPSLARATIRVTLHFLDPNVEVHLADELLEPARCARAIDEAMQRSIHSSDPADFPVKTAPHCRMCNFLQVCTAGRRFLSASA